MLKANQKLREGKFCNVALTPTQHHSGGKLIGGLSFPDQYPDFARHNRAGKPSDVRPATFSKTPRKISGTYIYGGLLMHHFGHFIVECLHRLWITDKMEYKQLPVLFIGSPNEEITDVFLEQAGEYFGINNFTVIREDAIVENLIIGEMSNQFKSPEHPQHSHWITKRYEANLTGANNYPKKLAIMRSHIKTGSILGEHHIEKLLAENGYHIFKPEEQHLKEQLLHIAAAEKIVFSEGSAIHLIDLLPPIKADVAILHRRSGSRIPQDSLQGKVKSYCSLRDTTEIIHPNPKVPNAAHRALSYIPLNEVFDFLECHHFVPTGSRRILPPEMTYAEELIIFANEQLNTKLEDSSALECALDKLFQEKREMSNRVKRLQYRYFLTSAYWARDQGDYKKARDFTQRALRHIITDEAETLMKQIDRLEARSKSALGRIAGAISRIMKPARVKLVEAPQDLYPR